MPIFTEAEIDQDFSTFSMFRDGGIVLFRSMDLFERQLEQLADRRYLVHRIDCPHSKDSSALLTQIIDALEIHGSASVGLDGFNDYLLDMSFGQEKGKVIAIAGFHHYRNKHKNSAKSLLDILSDHHRINLLSGNRLLVILQSNDPAIDQKIGDIGGQKIVWNHQEWMLKDRGL